MMSGVAAGAVSANIILVPYSSRRSAMDRPLSRALTTSLQIISQEWFGRQATVLSYEKSTRIFRPLLFCEKQAVGSIFAGRVISDCFILNRLSILPVCNGIKRSSDCINFYSPAFFLLDFPCHRELSEAGKRQGLALCAQMSSRDLYGVSWDRESGGRRLLHAALGWLTETVEEGVEPARELLELFSVPPSRISCENSVAMKGVINPESRRASDSPVYTNTAFAEAIFSGDGKSRLADDLIMQRDRSRTPWIFNSLLNSLEYAAGASELASAPPEIHVSSTGLCNLTCRFCTYTSEVGKPSFLPLGGLKKLAVLKWAKTLRLSAGLGEPTLNPALAKILRGVAAEQPHIAMNFFTNGVEMPDSLQQALIDAKVGWINVSLNAANAETWTDLCGVDKFAVVARNLAGLKKLKRERRSIQPLVFASIVLTRRSMHDLPALPKLCADLGIDRLSGFPFFAFGYGGEDKYGPEECFQAADPCYEALYEESLLAAEKHGISLELPLPERCRKTSSIMAERPLHDFCRIEQNEHRLDKLLRSVLPPRDAKKYCFFLWRQASIGSVNRTQGEVAATHYLYPCLGPLSGMNFSSATSVDFSSAVDFFARWNHPLLLWLRRAQQESGLCAVCELCMSHDTRKPDLFPLMNECLEQAGLAGFLKT